MKVDENDLLEFLLCALQKDKNCVNIELNENSYIIDGKFKCDLGDIKLSMTIYNVDKELRVIEFQK